ncbi:RDD family protein [Nocardiopsis sp. Huas11]|uniref:RDD family protein n=1 Tax=Nocardiopsis sp. Huas11 TaxID=2183912 RepID=UPI000F15A25E|nr:RDD family protein [Nocardiopsis sp. Huas11]RKS07714.1 RDD family protein [Nocardiopsis sp. Huas11]
MNVPPYPPGHAGDVPPGAHRPPRPAGPDAAGPDAAGPAGTGGPGGPGGPRPDAAHTAAAASGAPAAGEGPYPLAPWTSRALARLVDLVVVGLPALLVALVLSLAVVGLRAVGAGGYRGDHFASLLAVVFFVVHTGYETVSVALWRQTLGKRVVGLKVAPVAAAGRLAPIPAGAVTARAALYGLPVLLLPLPGWLWWPVFLAALVCIGGMAYWDRPNRQGLHDRIAGTVVLKVGR